MYQRLLEIVQNKNFKHVDWQVNETVFEDEKNVELLSFMMLDLMIMMQWEWEWEWEWELILNSIRFTDDVCADFSQAGRCGEEA